MDGLQPVIDFGNNGNCGVGNWGGALIGGAIGGAVGSAVQEEVPRPQTRVPHNRNIDGYDR